MILDQLVAGDGVTEWRLPGTDLVVTVPDGWRVVVKDWGVNLLSIQEASNDASVKVAMDTGEEQWRGYSAADEDRAAQLTRCWIKSLLRSGGFRPPRSAAQRLWRRSAAGDSRLGAGAGGQEIWWAILDSNQ